MTSLDAVRARLTRSEGLPFANVLTKASSWHVLNDHGVTYRDRVFGPVVTRSGFLRLQQAAELRLSNDVARRLVPLGWRVRAGRRPVSKGLVRAFQVVMKSKLS